MVLMVVVGQEVEEEQMCVGVNDWGAVRKILYQVEGSALDDNHLVMF